MSKQPVCPAIKMSSQSKSFICSSRLPRTYKSSSTNWATTAIVLVSSLSVNNSSYDYDGKFFTTDLFVANLLKHLRSCQFTGQLVRSELQTSMKRQLLKQVDAFRWKPCNQGYYNTAFTYAISYCGGWRAAATWIIIIDIVHCYTICLYLHNGMNFYYRAHYSFCLTMSHAWLGSSGYWTSRSPDRHPGVLIYIQESWLLYCPIRTKIGTVYCNVASATETFTGRW